MTSEQIKWAAYILLTLSVSLILYRSLNRRDYPSALLCGFIAIAAYLLKARIG